MENLAQFESGILEDTVSEYVFLGVVGWLGLIKKKEGYFSIRHAPTSEDLMVGGKFTSVMSTIWAEEKDRWIQIADSVNKQKE